MKVEKINFNNHEIFNNLEVNFTDSKGDILNTIVVIGENGSGKTTLLKNIYDSTFRLESSFQNIINQDMKQSLYLEMD